MPGPGQPTSREVSFAIAAMFEKLSTRDLEYVLELGRQELARRQASSTNTMALVPAGHSLALSGRGATAGMANQPRVTLTINPDVFMRIVMRLLSLVMTAGMRQTGRAVAAITAGQTAALTPAPSVVRPQPVRPTRATIYRRLMMEGAVNLGHRQALMTAGLAAQWAKDHADRQQLQKLLEIQPIDYSAGPR